MNIADKALIDALRLLAENSTELEALILKAVADRLKELQMDPGICAQEKISDLSVSYARPLFHHD